jgi:hypothetical protein
MRLRRSLTGDLIDLASAPVVGIGGEARIHIVSGAAGVAAKVYHRPTADHGAKLAAMLANPPEDPMASQGLVSIAWPSELLLDADGSGQVMGFTMPLVSGTRPIIVYSSCTAIGLPDPKPRLLPRPCPPLYPHTTQRTQSWDHAPEDPRKQTAGPTPPRSP